MSSGSFASSFATIPPAPTATPTATPTAPHALSTFEQVVFWSIGYGGWMGIGMLPIILMATNSTRARIVLTALSAPTGALLMTALFGVMYILAAFVHCVLSVMVSTVFLHSCCASIALTAVTASLTVAVFDLMDTKKHEKTVVEEEGSDNAEESEDSDNAEESEEGSGESDNAEESEEGSEESEDSDNAEESEEGSEDSDNAEESEEGSEESDNAEESEEDGDESEVSDTSEETSETEMGSEVTEERGKPADANTSLLRSAPPLPESDDEEVA